MGEALKYKWEWTNVSNVYVLGAFQGMISAFLGFRAARTKSTLVELESIESPCVISIDPIITWIENGTLCVMVLDGAMAVLYTSSPYPALYISTYVFTGHFLRVVVHLSRSFPSRCCCAEFSNSWACSHASAIAPMEHVKLTIRSVLRMRQM